MNPLRRIFVFLAALCMTSWAPAPAAELGKTSLWMVFSNPIEGREQDYNDWYISRHMKDILALDGVASAQFFRIDAHQPPAPSTAPPRRTFRYLIIYEVSTAQLPALTEKVAKGLNMQLGPRGPDDVVLDLSQTEGRWFTPLTKRVTKKEAAAATGQQMLDLARKP